MNYFIAHFEILQNVHVVVRMICSGTVFGIIFLGGVFMVFGKETLKELFKKEKAKTPSEINLMD